MVHDISSLSKQEIDSAKFLLQGLIKTLQKKRNVGGAPHPLLPDEEVIFTALTHPERGDVVVTLIREKSNQNHIYVTNRRDMNCPFSVMEMSDIRMFPERRTIDGEAVEPVKGEVGLFLSSVQDQELVRVSKENRVDIYSVQLDLYDKMVPKAPVDAKDLKGKRLEDCSNLDKWLIYKSNWDMDNRRDKIEKDLFYFSLVYAKYKAPEKDEFIKLTPKQFSANIGQLIRDIYPPNVRRMLRIDYANDHKSKVEDVAEYLGRLIESIQSKQGDNNGAEYSGYLEEMEEHITDILKNDPEFLSF